jgi:hypothetical protein
MISNIVDDGYYSFGNGGIILDRVNDFDFLTISKEVEEMKQDFENADKANKDLVGQLEQEYTLHKSAKIIEKNALRLADYHNQQTMHSSKALSVVDTTQRQDYDLVLDSCWINFQKKHEFQPIHDHTGVYSFIIFYDIPFEIQKEQEVSPGRESRTNYAGLLNFHYVSYLGKLASLTIPADTRWKKRMLLFPADLKHSVYPFYSSNEYRITISGNLSIKHTGEI